MLGMYNFIVSLVRNLKLLLCKYLKRRVLGDSAVRYLNLGIYVIQKEEVFALQIQVESWGDYV